MLDVQSEQPCYIYGTIYMDMPLKPNVLEDISKDVSSPFPPSSRRSVELSAHRAPAGHSLTILPTLCAQKWITAPPPRAKYFSDEDEILLEDDSGRVKLVGDNLKEFNLVTGQPIPRCNYHGPVLICLRYSTGVIVAVLGRETEQGDFQVIDICFGGIPPHAPLSSVASSSKDKIDDDGMDVDDGESARIGQLLSGRQLIISYSSPTSLLTPLAASTTGSWVAVLSGLDITGGEDSASDLRTTLMVEWLMGELGNVSRQPIWTPRQPTCADRPSCSTPLRRSR